MTNLGNISNMGNYNPICMFFIIIDKFGIDQYLLGIKLCGTNKNKTKVRCLHLK